MWSSHCEDLSVWHHGRVAPCDVQVALVELAEAPARHLGLVPPIHLADVEALDVVQSMLGHVPRKGDCQVIPAGLVCADSVPCCAQQAL